MTMNERKVEGIRNEIDKYTKSLTRYESIAEKKLAKAEKLGCADWTNEQFREAYGNSEYAKQVEAWFDLEIARDNVNEMKEKIERAKARLEKEMPKAEADRATADENERLEELEKKAFKVMSLKDYIKAQEQFRKWLEEFKADCLKDGVVIEEYASRYITGKTKSNKHFDMYLNDGWTERSEHCYTLKIEGETIFTSGLFTTAYKMLKR